MKCPLLHGNIQKETDRETEKSIDCCAKFAVNKILKIDMFWGHEV